MRRKNFNCSVGQKNKIKTNQNKRALAGLPKKTDRKRKPQKVRNPRVRGFRRIRWSRVIWRSRWDSPDRQEQESRNRPGYRRIFANSVSSFMEQKTWRIRPGRSSLDMSRSGGPSPAGHSVNTEKDGRSISTTSYSVAHSHSCPVGHSWFLTLKKHTVITIITKTKKSDPLFIPLPSAGTLSSRYTGPIFLFFQPSEGITTSVLL